MESLERESVRSLYEQAADRLRSHFMGMRPGERVPTEAELTRFFQVGRSTIRKALQRLVEEGLLVRSPGKGTFIARAVPCIIHSIDRVSAFMDTFRRNGEDVRTQMIDPPQNQRPRQCARHCGPHARSARPGPAGPRRRRAESR